jgi:hypothetical protein
MACPCFSSEEEEFKPSDIGANGGIPGQESMDERGFGDVGGLACCSS